MSIRSGYLRWRGGQIRWKGRGWKGKHANAARAECQCSHNVELVALHCLRRRVLQVVMRLVVHVPIIAGVHAVVVAARA